MTEWVTISVKIRESIKSAIVEQCEHKGVTVNAFLSEMINREMSEELDPGKIPKGKGIPLIGRMEFTYDEARDNFAWCVNMGPRGVLTLAENVPAAFLESMAGSARGALESRDRFRKAMHSDQVVVPEDVKEYVVQ